MREKITEALKTALKSGDKQRASTLRMVNATELLSSTQSIANKAWRDNSAITTRVADRYNTTANRLKMLNNRAQLTAATFADTVFFANSGTEAIECALKMARKYHAAKGRPDRIDVLLDRRLDDHLWSLV